MRVRLAKKDCGKVKYLKEIRLESAIQVLQNSQDDAIAQLYTYCRLGIYYFKTHISLFPINTGVNTCLHHHLKNLRQTLEK